MNSFNRCITAVFFLCSLLMLSCSSARQGQVFQWHDKMAHLPLDYEALMAADPIGPDEALKVYSLGKSAAASYHLVQVQTQEPLHIHRKHEGTAILLKGEGTLRVGKHAVKLRSGDVASIPKNTIHAYINEAAKPSLLYVMFAPPYEGKDRIIVKVIEPLLK